MGLPHISRTTVLICLMSFHFTAQVSASIDGGSFNEVFAFRFDADHGDASNSHLRVDTDGDGAGDGDYLTSSATVFRASIAGSGSTLALQLSLSADAGEEGFGIDDISVSGDLPTTTTPTTTTPIKTTPVDTTPPATTPASSSARASTRRTIYVETFDTKVRAVSLSSAEPNNSFPSRMLFTPFLLFPSSLGEL